MYKVTATIIILFYFVPHLSRTETRSFERKTSNGVFLRKHPREENVNHNVDFVPELPKKIVDQLIAEYKSGRNNEDVNLNTTQLFQKYGYNFEVHEVQTEDGYILNVFRLPSQGRPVFLMHGLVGSADDWFAAGAESALGYHLASEGYDVWIGNARGNKFSRRHTHLSPDHEPESRKFWNFSWDEIGRFDLPAMIDYVLNQTQQTRLLYVGHSQGTTSFFVMTSMRPENNDKIALMVALSPVVWMNHIANPVIRMNLPLFDKLYSAVSALGIYEIAANDQFMTKFQRASCAKGDFAELICNHVFFLLGGFNYAQINASNLQIILSHFPSGASSKQIIHYTQEMQSGNFCRFDYGERDNLLMYGRKDPPSYPLENVTAPIALFYSDADWLSSDIDVRKLRGKLRNVVDDYMIPSKNFNHFDFIWARDVKKLINHRVLQLFKSIK